METTIFRLAGSFVSHQAKACIGRVSLNVNPCRILGLYWGYIGIMEKKMQTTSLVFRAYGVDPIIIHLPLNRGYNTNNGKTQMETTI